MVQLPDESNPKSQDLQKNKLNWFDYLIHQHPKRKSFLRGIYTLLKISLALLILGVGMRIFFTKEGFSQGFVYAAPYFIAVLVVTGILILIKKFSLKFGAWCVTGLLIGGFLVWLSGREGDIYAYLCLAAVWGLSILAFYLVIDKYVVQPIDEDLPFRFPSFIKGLAFILMFLPVFWVCCSLLEHFWIDRTSSTNLLKPERFIDKRKTAKSKTARIGLALSGGGYRAAIMHAGVIHALEELGYAPTHIAAISGGAIVGSFYSSGGNPKEFKELVINRKFNLKRDITKFGNAVHLMCPLQIPWTDVRLLPCDPFSRTDIQAAMLDRVMLNGNKFSDLKEKLAPKLMIGTTDLNSGLLLGISADGVFLIPRIFSGEKNDYTNKGGGAQPAKFLPTKNLHLDCQTDRTRDPCGENLSTFVAASGAFPFAFNAIPKNFDLDRTAERRGFESFGIENDADTMTTLLADGGIIDNTGLFLLLHAAKRIEAWDMDFIFLSDASATFSERHDIKSPQDEVLRAIDVVYNSTGMFPYKKLEDNSPTKKIDVVNLSPSSIDLTKIQSGMKGYQDYQRYLVDILLNHLFASGDKEFVTVLELLINNIHNDEKKVEIESLYSKVKEELRGEQTASQSLEKLKALLVEEISASRDNFQRIDTIKDAISEEEADRLFWLGIYLVFEQLDNIQLHFRKATEQQIAIPVKPYR